MNGPGCVAVTVVIPTYRRERLLVETLQYLLSLEHRAQEMVVVDQTGEHAANTQRFLENAEKAGSIRWIRLPQPSVTAAMNVGLLESRQPVVVFVDDDVRPDPMLLRAHADAHAEHAGSLVAGRVVQPWDVGRESADAGVFHFSSTVEQWVQEFIGCNFSVPRAEAIALGGFDENFVRVAYRFEAEFAHRWSASGRRILFSPRASLHHLKAEDGGTRSFGQHLTTWRPDHAVGAYYFALRTGAWREFAMRPVRAVTTRFHLRHPWRIPPTLVSELGGMLWAFKLYASGPRRLAPSRIEA
jgi:GT2 family glycosyltransferase